MNNFVAKLLWVLLFFVFGFILGLKISPQPSVSAVLGYSIFAFFISGASTIIICKLSSGRINNTFRWSSCLVSKLEFKSFSTQQGFDSALLGLSLGVGNATSSVIFNGFVDRFGMIAVGWSLGMLFGIVYYSLGKMREVEKS